MSISSLHLLIACISLGVALMAILFLMKAKPNFDKFFFLVFFIWFIIAFFYNFKLWWNA